MSCVVRVQEADFDLGVEIRALRSGNPAIGAVASFIGCVRDMNEGDSVGLMYLEHYPGMTERELEKICAEASGRWDILDTLVIHRVGELKPLDQIVCVVVTSAHRGESFSACEFIMDYLKRARRSGSVSRRRRASAGSMPGRKTTRRRSAGNSERIA